MLENFFSNFTRKLISFLRMACVLVAFVANGLSAAETRTPVALGDLPAPVQKAVGAQLAGFTVGTIERVVSEGETTFEIEATKAGQSRTHTFEADGRLASVEVLLAETPAAVQQAIKSVFGAGKIDGIEKLFEIGRITFSIDFTTTNGLERDFTVGADGRLLDVQIGLDEAPAPVRAAVDALVRGGGTVGDVYRSFEGGAPTYDVTITRSGVARDFSLLPNGAIESEQVFFAELPPAVRETVAAKITGGKLVRIDKYFGPKGGFTYEVESVRGGAAFDFSVGAKGKFLGKSE